jgi:hypothetical protein
MLGLAIFMASVFMASVATYAIGFAWMKSYIVGLCEYQDKWHESAVTAAILWPLVIFGVIIRPALIYFSALGTKMSEKDVLTRKFRVKAEEKLRIEHQKLEEEIERELTETLRSSHK